MKHSTQEFIFVSYWYGKNVVIKTVVLYAIVRAGMLVHVNDIISCFQSDQGRSVCANQ